MSRSKRIRNVSSELRKAARELRRSPTEGETRLWEHLRAGRLDGLKFRRQHAVGRFVLDFYCAAAKFGVEVDGGVHNDQRERDAARSAELNAHGIRVIRFRNEEVVHELPAVLARIRMEARTRHPPLPELGEGAGGEGR